MSVDPILDDLVASRRESWRKLMTAIDAENAAREAFNKASAERSTICSQDELIESKLHKYVKELAK